MKKVITKGYTISVTSWENDGDNYRTKSMTVESKDEAEAISKLCKTLFKSCNNRGGGIGNSMDDDGDNYKELIAEHMMKYPVLIKEFLAKYSELIEGKEAEEFDEYLLDELVNICMHYNYELMGGSEYYYSRVCEKCEVTYSDKDVFLEEVKF